MSNCKMCGRELPSFSVGREPDLCPECHAIVASHQAAAPRPAAVPRPPVTTVLVGLNALVFIAMVLTGISPVAPNTEQLLRWGADYGPYSLNAQPWRILASNYVHIGIIHIGLNMWCLWNLGLLAERIFDPWTYVLTYTACGIAGSLASLWIHPLGVGAGASGAIFGLAGALIAALYLGHLPVPKSAIKGTLKSLLSFAGYNLFFGAVVPFIDNSAHVGGLLMGLAIGALLSKHLMTSSEERSRWRRLVFIAVTIVLFGVGTYVKKKNGNVLPPSNSPESSTNHVGTGARKLAAAGLESAVLAESKY